MSTLRLTKDFFDHVEWPSVNGTIDFDSGHTTDAKKTLLLVDDERTILNMMNEFCRESGYEVMMAVSGKEALDIYQNHKDDIDLVLLDMILPGMGGFEIFQQLQAIDPKVNVVISTGFCFDGEIKEMMQKGCKGCLYKPYGFEEFLSKIESVMAS